MCEFVSLSRPWLCSRDVPIVLLQRPGKPIRRQRRSPGGRLSSICMAPLASGLPIACRSRFAACMPPALPAAKEPRELGKWYLYPQRMPRRARILGPLSKRRVCTKACSRDRRRHGTPAARINRFHRPYLKRILPEALDAATKSPASVAYLSKPGQRPMVDYLLDFEAATRFPNPVWHVLWGGTLSSPTEYSATVDANTGKIVAHD